MLPSLLWDFIEEFTPRDKSFPNQRGNLLILNLQGLKQIVSAIIYISKMTPGSLLH